MTNQDQDITSSINYPTTGKKYIGLDMELDRYQIDNTEIILHDWAEGTDLYTVVGRATTVKEAIQHEGPVIQNGHFREFTENEDGSLVSHHPMAGRKGYHRPDDEFSPHVILLEKAKYKKVTESE